GSGKAEEARRRDREDDPRAPPPGVPQDLQEPAEHRRRAGDQRLLHRLPHAHPPAGDAAAQARRDGLLRRLPPNPLLGETAILKIKAFVDGACRGNPGPASYGVYMTSDREVIEICGYLGTTTNNVAEYSGLLEALKVAKEEGATEVEIVSDSLLLVQQMLGKYKVK